MCFILLEAIFRLRLKSIRYIINNIYFNQKCLHKNVISNFTKINIRNTSPASKFTQRKTSITKLNDEIKYLYIKKQQLNHVLQLHLTLANSWNNLRHC